MYCIKWYFAFSKDTWMGVLSNYVNDVNNRSDHAVCADDAYLHNVE